MKITLSLCIKKAEENKTPRAGVLTQAISELAKVAEREARRANDATLDVVRLLRKDLGGGAK